MFAFSRKPKLTESSAYDIAFANPGMVVIAPTFIKVYLADVNTMCTTHVKTKKMSKEEALEVAKKGLATERHHQIYI